MASSLTDIRNALKHTLSQAGLQVYSTAVDVVNAPAAVVQPSRKTTADFTGAMGMGGDTYYFDVIVLVADTEVTNAQHLLDQYVTGRGPKSVREFIFKNNQLGLDDVYAVAEGVYSYGGSPRMAGIRYIGAIVRVMVTVT